MSHLIEVGPGRKPTDLTIRFVDRASGTVVELPADCPAPVEPQVEEGIRWYLEEFPAYPFEPAPTIARRVEQDLDRIGADLFRAVLESTTDLRSQWEGIRASISTTCFQVALEGTAAGDLPWELIRDPLDPVPLACRAERFVRVPETSGPGRSGPPAPRVLRVLSVISRPGGNADVGFRSVAAHVLQQPAVRRSVDFQVLRPSTFDALADALEAAHAAGRPFSVLHFDGHGIYADLVGQLADVRKQRPRGYLMFEDPDSRSGAEPVDGSTLGRLLARYDVPIVVLNACRSARAHPAAAPVAAEVDRPVPERSFPSLAHEMLAAGTSAVVAMRYNVQVETAARFVSDVYLQLASGRDLAQAVGRARDGLFAEHLRSARESAVSVKDWVVPILFESAPVVLALPGAGTSRTPVSEVSEPASEPFVGRDDPLMEIHRLFGAHRIVVLWGQEGMGKSATAAEYTRWFEATSGREVVVQHFRVEAHSTAATVLDAIDAGIGAQQDSSDQASVGDDEKQRVLIERMAASTCLWVLDDFDTSADADLPALVFDAAAAGISVLLTARGPLADAFLTSAEAVELSPLDDADRIALASAVCGVRSLPAPEIWRPLLARSQGNPAVLVALVRAALHEGVDSSTAMDDFLGRLGSPGTGPLLSDTLVRTLRAEFSPEDRYELALCTYFDGAVNSSSLSFLRGFAATAQPELPTDSATTQDLLSRAADLGALSADLNGWYHMHPGLQEFLQALLVEHYSPEERERFAIGFVRLHATIARTFSDHYWSGTPTSDRTALDTLGVAENSLRRALAMARDRMLWREALEVLGGLDVLLNRSHRWSDFGAVLDSVIRDYLEPESGLPRDGDREAGLYLLSCRVDQLRRSLRLHEAAELQRTIVDGYRSSAGDSEQLARALHGLATIERIQGSATWVMTERSALAIAQRGQYHGLESEIAHALGDFYAFSDTPDFAAADFWLTYGLEVVPSHDAVGRGSFQLSRGQLALARLHASVGADQDLADQELAEAIRLMELALSILPGDLLETRAAGLANLGLAYFDQGVDLGRSVLTFEKALHHFEQLGDQRRGATARLNLARVLRSADDLERARLYAETALKTLASLAPYAETDVVAAQGLVASLAAGRPENGARRG